MVPTRRFALFAMLATAVAIVAGYAPPLRGPMFAVDITSIAGENAAALRDTLHTPEGAIFANEIVSANAGGGRSRFSRDGVHRGIGHTAHIENEVCLTGDFARTMHRGVGEQLSGGDDEIGSRVFVLQPDRLHMVQQCDGRGDGIMAMRPIDRTGMGVLADAACIAKPFAAANARYYGGGQSLRDQSGTLLDVQFQVGTDLR